jgi:glycosyltransferase involved in cell wall biosynthesis
MSSMRQDPSHRAGPDRAREGADAGRPGWLSVVVPAKDEADGLPQLVREIVQAFRPLTARPNGSGHRLEGFEVVLVDDGSTDTTPDVLRSLMAENPELRPVRLARNVGQSGAIAAGFWAARGAWVGILDADLQNPPSELAKLWDALPGHDVALGWRLKRRDVAWKRWISRTANRVRNAVLRESIRDTGCSVRIFPRSVARRLPMFHGAHRFFGALLIREGCSIVQVPVEHRARPYGQSHYNFWNRSTRVVEDLFGVAWLMRRPVRFSVDPGAFAEAEADRARPSVPAAHVGLAGPARVESAAGREG